MARDTFPRSLETGALLGSLLLLLAATGILLSPTVMAALGLRAAEAGVGNPLYVAHLTAGALLVGFLAWHVAPIARRFLTRLDSATLLALVAVEVYTGVELWRHWYVPLPKAVAVMVHLLVTASLLLPMVTHAARGLRKWRARRDALAKARALQAPEAAWARDAGAARRLFLRLSAYAVAGVAIAWAFGSSATRELGEWRVNSIGRTPELRKESYQLRVTGLVNRPIVLSYDDLLRMRQVELRFTHHCVEGWTYEDTFTGVPLPDVLAAAGGVKAGAKQLVFKSPEVSRSMFDRGAAYSTNFPVADGMHDDVLLVHSAHGEDLPPIHGFPVRLMTPRKWGYKACKWLTEIEVTGDASYRGYWERAGYHNDGDYPGPIFA